MTKYTKHIATMALAAGVAQAAPFLAISDSAELFLTADVTVQADDNVLLANDSAKQSDTVFKFIPGLSLEFGKNALTTGKLTFKDEIRRYSDLDVLDQELISTAFNVAYAEAKTKIYFDASYAELAQNTRDEITVGALTRRDVSRASGSVEIAASTKSKVSVGAKYTKTDYKTAGFTDSKITEVPLFYYFEATPKLDLSFGARFRATELAGTAVDSEGYFLSVGARGEFTPKLSGSFSIGYNQRELDNGTDRSGLGLDSKLIYAVTDKTKVNLSLGNDFGVGGLGDSQENRTVGLGATSQIMPELSVGANLNYRQIKYFDAARGTDDYYELGLTGTYTVNEYFTVIGAASYRENFSVLPTGDFSGTVFSLTARLRY